MLASLYNSSLTIWRSAASKSGRVHSLWGMHTM